MKRRWALRGARRCPDGDRIVGEEVMAANPVSTHPSADVASSPTTSAVPSIGADESGKGDYFGPLVSAALFADADCAERLTAIGVQDCKQLSDKHVRELAPQVRAAVG